MFKRKRKPFALDRVRECRCNVEVQSVAELVGLRRSAGFDAGRKIAGIVPSKARLAQRAQQIAQRFEPQEVETLVGDLKPACCASPVCPPAPDCCDGSVRLIDRNIVFLLHPLDELLYQFIELAVCHHLLDLLTEIFIKRLAIQQGILDGAPEVFECLLALRHFVPHGILKAALQQIVRERTEQVLHAHFPGRIGNVFGVTNAFHKASDGLCAVSHEQTAKNRRSCSSLAVYRSSLN